MENLILLLTASLVLYKASKQFRKTSIGHTGCSVLYSPDAVFDFTCSEEGDALYYAEHTEKGITYGVLCGTLREPLPLEEAGSLLSTYMNRLREPFGVPHATGLETRAEGEGPCLLQDYWQDEAGQDWKVKGYTNGETLGVLYVKNIAEAETSKQEAFLDSFCFPA